jgi:ABC-type multidrug transport system ATPase subunit
MDRDIAIETRGLSKVFARTTAVDTVTFTVRRGEVFGFMGHNGAGKTTTLRMLLGYCDRPKAAQRCSATTSLPTPLLSAG